MNVYFLDVSYYKVLVGHAARSLSSLLSCVGSVKEVLQIQVENKIMLWFQQRDADEDAELSIDINDLSYPRCADFRVEDVIPHRLGRVFGDGVGYELLQLPRTVRVPDASYVHADRPPASGVGPGLLRFAPDVAIEVLSPSETKTGVQEKIDDYVSGGTTLIWVVDVDEIFDGIARDL